jgi:hypothetical protein
VLVLLQSANERFVNLDHLAFAAELHGEMTVTHSLAKTTAHEPSNFASDASDRHRCSSCWMPSNAQPETKDAV